MACCTEDRHGTRLGFIGLGFIGLGFRFPPAIHLEFSLPQTASMHFFHIARPTSTARVILNIVVPPNILILIMGTPKKDTPNFGKPLINPRPQALPLNPIYPSHSGGLARTLNQKP